MEGGSRMIRLLIVDDEPDITDGIYTLLKENSSFERDVYKAYSGKSALEWLRRGKFDIVVTDIRMPGMNGIELHSQIRRLWPRCKVIFLTGHSEFDYVYEAISHDNTKYLLKTEGHDTIMGAVEQAVREIRSELHIEGLVVQAMQQLEQTQPLLQNELLLGLLNGDAEALSGRERQFAELGLQLDASRPVLLMFGKLGGEVQQPRHTPAQLHTGMKVITTRYASPHLVIALVRLDRETYAWLAQGLHERSEEERASAVEEEHLQMQEFAENASEACLESFGLPLSLTLDRQACDWYEIADRAAMLRRELKLSGHGARDEGGGLLSVSWNENAAAMERTSRKLGRLEQMLENGQSDAFATGLTGLLEGSAATPQMHEFVHHSLSLLLLRHLHRHNLHERLMNRFDLTALLRMQIGGDTQEMLDYFRQAAAAVFEQHTRDQRGRSDDVIASVKRYIHDHLGEDISLVRLAEEVDLNPSYLSRLFKQATGKNLLAYIHDTKLGEAERLLVHSPMKIHEISQWLGFVSPSHFTRFFKKHAGCTPLEFRERSEAT
ncbi:response regulator [Paenibacillaceae bacterium]|nr:response regulator [Paenibacillaceae bacterium]